MHDVAVWGAANISACKCDNGYTRIAHGCVGCTARTYKARRGDEECDACLCGKYAPNASTTCTDCPAGTAAAAPVSSLTECRICSRGYISSAGSCACNACPQGKFQFQSDYTACVDCPAGKAGAVANATSMVEGCAVNCTPGQYSDSGSTACRNCGVGTYSGETHLKFVSHLQSLESLAFEMTNFVTFDCRPRFRNASGFVVYRLSKCIVLSSPSER